MMEVFGKMFCSTENRITVWLFQIVNPFASNEQHFRQLFIYLFFFRSNRPEVFCKKGALRNFIKFTGKHLCQSLIFNKVLLKMRLWHRCFPMNFVKFLRTPFLQNTSGRLLLTQSYVVFIQAILSKAILPVLPILLSLLSLWWFFKFRSPDCWKMHFWHSFLTVQIGDQKGE